MSITSETGAQVGPRPQRADARRNRERIVVAARAVFGERGREAQMDDIARAAGVGVGTVYRHFPTKEALLEALAADKFEHLAAEARAALAADDAWLGFQSVMWAAAERMAADRALFDVMQDNSELVESIARGKAELHAAIAELIARAQAAGRMRPDAVPGDVPLMMCSLGAAMRQCNGDRTLWQRHFGMMLDALRVQHTA